MIKLRKEKKEESEKESYLYMNRQQMLGMIFVKHARNILIQNGVPTSEDKAINYSATAIVQTITEFEDMGYTNEVTRGEIKSLIECFHEIAQYQQNRELK